MQVCLENKKRCQKDVKNTLDITLNHFTISIPKNYTFSNMGKKHPTWKEDGPYSKLTRCFLLRKRLLTHPLQSILQPPRGSNAHLFRHAQKIVSAYWIKKHANPKIEE